MDNEPMLVHILQKVDEVRDSQIRMEGRIEGHLDSCARSSAMVERHDKVLRIIIVPFDIVFFIMKKLRLIS